MPDAPPDPTAFADEYQFDLDGGRLCLDFANSLFSSDRLRSYVDFIGFARQSGLLDDDQAHLLRARAASQPDDTAAFLQRAKTLRAALFRIFSAVVRRQPPAEVDLALFNNQLASALANQRIVAHEDGFAWAWADAPSGLDRLLWPIVRSAAELLTSEDRLDIRECAASDCVWLFVDASRNRSRQWCSMQTCGNRAKARRHYERLRPKAASRSASAANTGRAS